ncbi:uncharacterized protein LOC134185812 [Corticium candelabrum]|uniref:uncharacterized protein LOC134185812 n=1 Tax=Corticium candelabrum TaxID=121492 RepID=UPI002E26D53E|nr:uncharacterized protein LOC134185812 [Corticium candelabrum]
MRPAGQTLWIKPRESRWFDRMLAEASDTDWRENFRMSRGTFMSLCNDIRHLITKKSTHLRVPISPEKRLALTLYMLAGSEYYRTVSNLFGVGVSTASTISNEVCQAIVSHLSGQYVQMPQGDRLKKVIERFRNIGHGFPQIGGAVDGSHIPIKSPPLNPACYINRKGFHSIILQAVVDSFLYFNDICIGWPGRVHDARVLANSLLFAVAERAGTAFPGSETVVCNGSRIPVLILGDPAYPLKRWLMKAYPESANMRESEKSSNYKLSCARIAVERAFGLLKEQCVETVCFNFLGNFVLLVCIVRFFHLLSALLSLCQHLPSLTSNPRSFPQIERCTWRCTRRGMVPTSTGRCFREAWALVTAIWRCTSAISGYTFSSCLSRVVRRGN